MKGAERKSPEWLRKHRATIGGSNAAASVGLSQFKSQVQLYYEMTEGLADDLSDNQDVLRGILMEPLARERLSRVLDLEIIEHDQDDFIGNDHYPYAHALPDGFIHYDGARIPIEIKVPRPENWAKLDAHIPDHIQCQALHNAIISSAPALMLGCLNPVTMEVFTRLYEPTNAVRAALMDAEARFWNEHVVPRVPPDPVTHDDLKLRWPSHTEGRRITATEGIMEAHVKLASTKDQIRLLDKLASDLSLDVKRFMADAELLADENGTIIATYRSHRTKTLDSKRLRDGHPSVWEQYARENQVRTFLLKTSKD